MTAFPLETPFCAPLDGNLDFFFVSGGAQIIKLEDLGGHHLGKVVKIHLYPSFRLEGLSWSRSKVKTQTSLESAICGIMTYISINRGVVYEH